MVEGAFKVVYQVISLESLDRVFKNKSEIGLEDLRVQLSLPGAEPPTGKAC